MKRPMALATYEAEDGLVRHQWEEWSLSCQGWVPQCSAMPGWGDRKEWLGEHPHKGRRRGRCAGVSGGATKKGITFEMKIKKISNKRKKTKECLLLLQKKLRVLFPELTLSTSHHLCYPVPGDQTHYYTLHRNPNTHSRPS